MATPAGRSTCRGHQFLPLPALNPVHLFCDVILMRSHSHRERSGNEREHAALRPLRPFQLIAGLMANRNDTSYKDVFFRPAAGDIPFRIVTT